MSEVLGVCKESDVVVAVLGLDAGIEGEEEMPAMSTAVVTNRI